MDSDESPTPNVSRGVLELHRLAGRLGDDLVAAARSGRLDALASARAGRLAMEAYDIAASFARWPDLDSDTIARQRPLLTSRLGRVRRDADPYL